MKTRAIYAAIVLSMMLTLAASVAPTAGTVHSASLRIYPSFGGESRFVVHREVMRAVGLEIDGVDRGDSVLREDFASMVAGLVGAGEIGEMVRGYIVDIEDWDEISEQRRDAVAALRAMGLVEAGRFRPRDRVTHAEVATVLLRVLGVDPEEEAPYPAGPVLGATGVGMVDGWPGAHDEPADFEFVMGCLAWTRRELQPAEMGVVTEIGEERISISGYDGPRDLELASDVAIVGAPSPGALGWQMVWVHRDPDGLAGVIEAAEEIRTVVGTVEDHRIREERVLLDGGWVDISGLQWEFNGLPVNSYSPDDLSFVADRWVAEGTRMSVHRTESGRGLAEAFLWDLAPVAVVEAGEDAITLTGVHGHTDSVQIDRRQLEGVEMEGDVSDPDDLEEGDVLAIASLGAMGEIVHVDPRAVEVTREAVELEPLADDHRRARCAEGIRYYFETPEGEVELDPAEYLGNPADLLGAVHVEAQLDGSGSLAYARRVLAPRDVEIGVLLERRRVDRDIGFVLALPRGEVRLPGSGSVAAPDLGSEPQERLIRPVFDSDGSVEELLGVDASPLGVEVTVLAAIPGIDSVVLAVEDARGEETYQLAESPWIVDSDGRPVSPGDLEVGDELRAWEAEDHTVFGYR